MNVCCDREAASSVLLIKVHDTGIGMNAEQMGRIFQPFAQGEESTTRKFGGTGLGLTISRTLARLLGGDIEVISEVGVGSGFSVCIDGGPLDDADMIADLTESMLTAITAENESEEISIQGRVLLVEDGRDNRRLLSSHLKFAGAEVVIAENGQIAVDLVGSSRFDLILMDMQMPVMDGYCATRELRSRGVKTPIIALTAYAMSEDRAKCIACGCTDYLAKPVESQLLLQTIKYHLGQGSAPAASPPKAEVKVEPTDSIKSAMIDKPRMAKVIAEMVHDLPGDVQKIRTFLEKGETEALLRVIHQLKGAFGGYGFKSITELAAAAETAIKECEGNDAIKAKIGSLIQNIRRIEGYDAQAESVAA